MADLVERQHRKKTNDVGFRIDYDVDMPILLGNLSPDNCCRGVGGGSGHMDGVLLNQCCRCSPATLPLQFLSWKVKKVSN